MKTIEIEVEPHARWLRGRISGEGEKATARREAVTGRLQLRLPDSPVIAAELAMLGESSPLRAGAASIAVCWGAGVNLHRPVLRYTGNVAAYGEAAYNEFIQRGWTYFEIVALASRVFAELINPAVLPPEVVEEVQGNSAPLGAEADR